jgi:hypothetical protein
MFQCEPAAGPPDLWCYNGGSCDRAAVIPSCTCPPGFEHDLSLLHDYNCAKPEFAFLGVFVGSVLFALPVALLVLYYSAWSKNRELRSLGQWSLLGLAAMVATEFCVFVQAGFYEGAAVCWVVALSANCVTVFKFVSAMLKPPVPLDWQHTSRWIRAFMLGVFVCWAVCGALMVALCRAPDPGPYNNVVSLALVLFAVVNAVVHVVLLQHARAISRQVDASAHKELGEKLAFRIRVMRRGLWPNIIIGFVLNIPMPIQHWTQGSNPYNWLVGWPPRPRLAHVPDPRAPDRSSPSCTMSSSCSATCSWAYISATPCLRPRGRT